MKRRIINYLAILTIIALSLPNLSLSAFAQSSGIRPAQIPTNYPYGSMGGRYPITASPRNSPTPGYPTAQPGYPSQQPGGHSTPMQYRGYQPQRTSTYSPFQRSRGGSDSSRFYLGVNGNGSIARHHLKCDSRSQQSCPKKGGSEYALDDTIQNENIGYGFNSGFEFINDMLFVGPELFYDQLNNKSSDFYYRNKERTASTTDNEDYSSHTLELNHRYGAKLNAGLKYQGFGIYGSYGISRLNYDLRSYGGSDLTYHYSGGTRNDQIYGGGILYDISDNVTLRASYDRQNLTLKYCCRTPVGETEKDNFSQKDKVALEVFKLGLTYNFNL